MQMKYFTGDLRSLQGKVKNQTTINAVLVLLLGLSLFVTWTSHARYILVPPNLDERVSIGYDEADPHYHELWGLFVAEMVGNITPATVDFVSETLSGMFEPALYHQVREVLTRQVEDIKKQNLTISFTPRGVGYEPDTGKVFVRGAFTTGGPIAAPTVFERTYELRIVINNYKPTIVAFDAYPGEPRTREVLARREADEVRKP